jgi:hypothetical protein
VIIAKYERLGASPSLRLSLGSPKTATSLRKRFVKLDWRLLGVGDLILDGHAGPRFESGGAPLKLFSILCIFEGI